MMAAGGERVPEAMSDTSAADAPGERVSALTVGSPAESVSRAWLAPTGPAAHVTLSGLALADLADGTRLRIGLACLELVAREAEPGVVVRLTEATPASASRRALVLTPGMVRVGDPATLEAVPLPIGDSLDLHSFRPDETADVVREYLAMARAAGFGEVRIIHGRGQGVQRETVRGVLAASPEVAGYGDAPPERGGWGATVVRLAAGPRRPPP
jgi:Smr domain